MDAVLDALAAFGVVVLVGLLALIGLKSYLTNLRAPKKDEDPETPPAPRP